jgi:hypothetical protein
MRTIYRKLQSLVLQGTNAFVDSALLIPSGLGKQHSDFGNMSLGCVICFRKIILFYASRTPMKNGTGSLKASQTPAKNGTGSPKEGFASVHETIYFQKNEIFSLLWRVGEAFKNF